MNVPGEVHNFEMEGIQNNLFKASQEALDKEKFVDITLVSSDGKCISAHKLVLASQSEFFFKMFSQNLQREPFL